MEGGPEGSVGGVLIAPTIASSFAIASDVDIRRIDQHLVVLGQIAKRDAGINVVGQMESDIERHQEKPSGPMLLNRMGRHSTII